MADRPRLFFIRCDGAHEDEWEYLRRPDVLVLGDLLGYRHFSRLIRKACGSRKNVHVGILERCTTSMQCVILPPASTPKSPALLRTFERKLRVKREPEMELIIYGNAAGYRMLAATVDALVRTSADKPDDHAHIDEFSWRGSGDVDPYGPRLTIRGPLSKWGPQRLRQYAGITDQRMESYYPDAWELKPSEYGPWKEPYREPAAGKAPFVLR